MSLTLIPNFKTSPLQNCSASRVSYKEIWDFVELKGAKMTDFVVAFLIRELFVESRGCSVNKRSSVWYESWVWVC